MPDKIRPLGICDHCGGAIPRNRWYTRKDKLRLHCSLDCRNAANSQAGEPTRYRKMMERIERGEWINPVAAHPLSSEEQAERSRKARLREVEDGTWRNPALGADARQKLSRPRKHAGLLHSAIEKLRHGSMADLTEEEREAYRIYRWELKKK